MSPQASRAIEIAIALGEAGVVSSSVTLNKHTWRYTNDTHSKPRNKTQTLIQAYVENEQRVSTISNSHDVYINVKAFDLIKWIAMSGCTQS